VLLGRPGEQWSIAPFQMMLLRVGAAGCPELEFELGLLASCKCTFASHMLNYFLVIILL
jgi:hypothetical protein